MKFSQRIGKTPIKDVLQIESIDKDLKNLLWNTIIDIFEFRSGYYDDNELSNYIWTTFYKQAKDEIPRDEDYYNYF